MEMKANMTGIALLVDTRISASHRHRHDNGSPVSRTHTNGDCVDAVLSVDTQDHR